MIAIRKIQKVEDYRMLPEIQKSAWGFSDSECEPHHLMNRVQKYGGLVQGLFLDDVLIGFTYALLGKWEGTYFIYSHMAAVRKEYQGEGFGFMLKRAQREEVLNMGYDTIRWNFDPLESLNSYFNIHRLGAISMEYEKDIYGMGESGLHKGLPTDRLIATWYLKSDRVIRKMEKKDPSVAVDIPSQTPNRFTSDIAYIEIPLDIRALKQKNIKEALEWRMKTRGLFESAFQKGYVAEHMVFSKDKQRIFYQLKRRGSNP